MAASTDLEARQNRSTRRAEQRRAVVKGAVEGGTTGAVRGAAKTTRKTSDTSSGTRPSRAGAYARKRGKSFAISKLDSPASGALFAEYFGGALIIVLELFTKSASQGYMGVMSRIMMRLTALTMVFFVLFLMTGSKRGGQMAVWFGLLVDLGIVFTAARGQTFSTAADLISGKGTGITLDAATTNLETPHPQPVQLPDE